MENPLIGAIDIYPQELGQFPLIELFRDVGDYSAVVAPWFRRQSTFAALMIENTVVRPVLVP